jgi:hypothetical protein
MGVRSRALPLHVMRKLVWAAREGQNEVALTDDVFLVRKTPSDVMTPASVVLPREELVPLTVDERSVLTEMDVQDGYATPRDTRAGLAWPEWPFFTPPSGN